MGRYLVVFIIAFIGANCAVGALAYLTGWDLLSLANLILIVLESFLAGMYFVKKQSRLPSPAERRQLIWWSFGILLLVDTISLVGVLASLGLNLSDLTSLFDTPRGFVLLFRVIIPFGLSLLLSLVLNYITLWLGYGYLTNQFGRKLLAKQGL